LLTSMKLRKDSFGNITTASAADHSIPVAARLPGATALPTATASPVTRRGKTNVDVADANEMIRESDVAKMSDKEFEERSDEINKAMRNGKFVYDVSGNAR